MKRVLPTVLKIIILLVIAAYLIFCISLMATTKEVADLEAMGFLLLLVFGVYVNGGAFLLSLISLIISWGVKNAFITKTDKEIEGYEESLKKKKRDIVQYALLMFFAVASELLIFAFGSIICL